MDSYIELRRHLNRSRNAAMIDVPELFSGTYDRSLFTKASQSRDNKPLLVLFLSDEQDS